MARLQSIRRRLRSAAGLDARQAAMIAEAAVLLSWYRAVVQFVPRTRLKHWLGDFVAPTDPRVEMAMAPGTPEQAETAAYVRRAVASAARTPLFRGVCLPQAMAGRTMLKRRGIVTVMRFGAGPGKDKPLEAHAWLDAAGVKVTGYPVTPNLAQIACFL